MSYSNFGEAYEDTNDDLLAERYVDLQEELYQIENIFNISSDEDVDNLYEINEMLFSLIERIIPELIDEQEDNDQEKRYKEFLKKIANKKNPEVAKKDRVEKIKQREKAAVDTQKDKEEYVRARSFMKSAKIDSTNAKTPEEKRKATQNLQKARTHLDKLNKKDDKTKKEE